MRSGQRTTPDFQHITPGTQADEIVELNITPPPTDALNGTDEPLQPAPPPPPDAAWRSYQQFEWKLRTDAGPKRTDRVDSVQSKSELEARWHLSPSDCPSPAIDISNPNMPQSIRPDTGPSIADAVMLQTRA